MKKLKLNLGIIQHKGLLPFYLMALLFSSLDVKGQTSENIIDYSKIYSYCLDADIKSALPIIQQYKVDNLLGKDIKFKNEFEARFSQDSDKSSFLKERKSPINDLLKVYRDYWRLSLLDPSTNYSDVIKKDVSKILAREYKFKHVDNEILDEDTLYIYLKKYVKSVGLNTTGFVKTGKLYDFLVWKEVSDTMYHFSLQKELINVGVVFLDDFITLGWEEYATLGRYYPAGWIGSDAIYCVRSAYNLDDENFLISFLCHEGRHFADYKLYPKLNSVDMEYRAKLTELMMLEKKLYDKIEFFINNSNSKSQNAHSVANYCVIRDLSRVIFNCDFEKDLNKWKQISVNKINDISSELLDLNTNELRKLGPEVENYLKWNDLDLDSINTQTNVEEIKSIVRFLADDDKLGRENGSSQLLIVSNWIKEYFENSGLECFNCNFFQNYSYFNAEGDTIKERNVVGLLKSTDSNNQNYIIVSAHFDHLGIISGKKDSTYNGANDNASGVGLILSLIKELKQIQSRSYNVIFTAFSGEENGLKGSAHFAENLPVPREKIRLNLNFDMVGRTGNTEPFTFFITGSNYTNLKNVILDFNKNESWTLVQDTSSMNNFLFLMSDNYSLVKPVGNDTIKIPAHTFSTDTPDNAPNYHSPDDESKTIDYDNLANFSEYIYRLIDYIGQNNIEIKWTKEIVLHEFELDNEDGKFQIIKRK